MATSNDLLIKQPSVIEFLAAEGCSAANIQARMKTVYGEKCISDCAVRKWVRIFKGEDHIETILRDQKRSGLNPATRQCAPIHQSPKSGPLKAARTCDTTAPCIQPRSCPSDYYLFPQLKKYLKGHHYDNDEEVIADVRRWCDGQSSEFIADGVRQLVKRWRLCVDRDGDYVEK
ncbi:histone-lysine N-methyltransferase SETMAR [Plakobranchus ocellatus]|uniref:Histone-lysine N-methyltransferase SETMAR n=1 Tax=Plakobranchus ocellatus TaxID=259542 RepID=A0AAV4CHN8_9GAST|nr:histone-lysine N-methyltransferase SETMAR [Plakobranchus ocellatus]